MKTQKQRDEELKALKDSITNLITTDMSKEQIDSINSIANQVDCIKGSMGELQKENIELKDSLIANIRGTASTKSEEEEQQAPTLEALIAQTIAKRK